MDSGAVYPRRVKEQSSGLRSFEPAAARVDQVAFERVSPRRRCRGLVFPAAAARP